MVPRDVLVTFSGQRMVAGFSLLSLGACGFVDSVCCLACAKATSLPKVKKCASTYCTPNPTALFRASNSQPLKQGKSKTLLNECSVENSLYTMIT